MNFVGMTQFSTALADEAKDAIDYWKEYREERIRVERVAVASEVGSVQSPDKDIYGIQGTVEKVMSLPPGFVLKDAVEFDSVHLVKYNTHEEYKNQCGDHKHHDRIFIAFSTVERISFVDSE